MTNADTIAHVAFDALSTEQCEGQVCRVIKSEAFRNALILQQLLQFLTSKALHNATEILKEYTIGVEALGRKPDFDPKLDSIVRVQNHRLRLKLKEYYVVEGATDPILIQLPKGHYLPTFELMSASARIFSEPTIDESEPRDSDAEILSKENRRSDEAVSQSGLGLPSGRRWAALIAAPLVLIMVALLAYWLGGRETEKHAAAPTTSATALSSERKVESFWGHLLGTDTSPVIAYADAVFLLDDSNDLFRFRHGAIDSRGALVDPHVAHEFASNPALVAQAGHLYYENGYTGTGELESVAMLAGLFGRMGLRPIIKSSRDITPDDLSQHNVILLGSSSQNPAVAQLLAPGDFTFQNPDQHHEQWRAQILNAHPSQGEAAAYRTERDPATRALTADYSLITIGPSVIPGRWIITLGGLDTKGTEGAAMFATSEFGVGQMEKALEAFGGKSKADMVPFQALIRVRLAKGYQVLGADLISVHALPEHSIQAPDISSASGH